MAEYHYLEIRIAEQLGVSSATIRKTRKSILVEGRDCALVQQAGRQKMAYTLEAAEKLVNHVIVAHELQADDMSNILTSASVRPHRPPDPPASSSDEVQTDPGKLIAGPWEVPVGVLVVSHITRNDKILMAHLEIAWTDKHGFQFFHKIHVDPRKKMRVRVKCSENFIPGMKLQARWIQQDLWECTQRMPRWRGRW